MAGVGHKILRLLRDKPRQTPPSIAKELQLSVTTVRNALVILSDVSVVEAGVRGLYEITPLGVHVLKKLK